MKKAEVHTTNYFDTFIEVAEDCKALASEVPPLRGAALSIANIQYDLIARHPYQHTSDDVIFHCFATKHDLTQKERKKARELFFSKGQACLRSSPLTKRYGWGIHCNEEGKVALVAMGSKEYQKLRQDPKLKHVKAMRSKRA